jgi:hypothetical protein
MWKKQNAVWCSSLFRIAETKHHPSEFDRPTTSRLPQKLWTDRHLPFTIVEIYFIVRLQLVVFLCNIYLLCLLGRTQIYSYSHLQNLYLTPTGFEYCTPQKLCSGTTVNLSMHTFFCSIKRRRRKLPRQWPLGSGPHLAQHRHPLGPLDRL